MDIIEEESKEPLTKKIYVRMPDAQRAQMVLHNLGPNFSTKNNTLLHLSVRSSPVSFIYVFAHHGVPVNVQNQDGDTALHLAARAGRYGIAEALMQCGSDLSIRNKLGQTASDEAIWQMEALIHRYKPGVVTALLEGKICQLKRLIVSMWCSVHTLVKGKKTLAQLAESMAGESQLSARCAKLISCYSTQSALTHAVLAEDTDKLQTILTEKSDWNLNTRLRDCRGPSLLSCAIERNNYKIVKTLVDFGAKVNSIRVHLHNTTDITDPLLHRTLDKSLNIELMKFLHSKQDEKEWREKDTNGNTPILRAVEADLPAAWVSELLEKESGKNISDRNQDGLTPRELAELKGRDDIVFAIDKHIFNSLGKMGLVFHMAVNFYGSHNFNIMNEHEVSLIQAAEEMGANLEIRTLMHLTYIEHRGIELMRAASTGNLEDVIQLNDASYKDKNGYTALTKAIVHNQYEVAEQLCQDRPALKSIPDNCNRYPLHYAYALPEEYGSDYVQLLLESRPEELDKRQDMNGRVPADYMKIRNTSEINQILEDVKWLDQDGYQTRVIPLS